jgi:hypothetical protein
MLAISGLNTILENAVASFRVHVIRLVVRPGSYSYSFESVLTIILLSKGEIRQSFGLFVLGFMFTEVIIAFVHGLLWTMFIRFTLPVPFELPPQAKNFIAEAVPKSIPTTKLPTFGLRDVLKAKGSYALIMITEGEAPAIAR